MTDFLTTDAVVDASSGLPVTLGAVHWWRRIHQITIPSIKAGDRISVTGACCVSNVTSYNVQFVDELTMGGRPNWVEDCPTVGSIIKPPGGMNITPANHYWRPSLAWQWQAPSDMGDCVLEWRVMAHSDYGDNTILPMLPGYGGMQVTVARCA